MIYLLIFLIVTIILVMIPRQKSSLILAGSCIFFIVIISSVFSVNTLISDSAIPTIFNMSGLSSIPLVSDKLSAFFILIINFTVVTGFIYSTGYLKPYLKNKPDKWIKLHYLAMVWLHASMIMVPLLRNGFWFLIAWEIMTLSSFVLVIFDFDEKGTIKAGLTYLIQMHVGMLFILIALIISSRGMSEISFDNLGLFFMENKNWPVFLLFFIGFGLKAGFFLLHTWLPDAHPSAPSHVSGIMSGVMIKLGIYGILRVTTFLHGDFTTIGAAVIIISAITGLFGVMMAILQHDVKKLLAYHSIENIGIIGLGIGLGILGISTGNILVAAAGFAGALLHTLNHSLFKSLLFYSAGSVINQVHVRDIEKMGGIMKYMPLTGWAFLIGSIAIAGLPPLNGFISEFLIYISMFDGLPGPDFNKILLLFIAILSLVLIGGLALLCFTKVFSVVFLGQNRTEYSRQPAETEKSMLVSQLLPMIPILIVGLLPVLIIKPLLSLTGTIFGLSTAGIAEKLLSPMMSISIGSVSLILIILIIVGVRKLALRKYGVKTGPTWGCGYTAVDARQQYTATSFIQEYANLSKPVIKTGFSRISYPDEEIFAKKREFHSHSDDFIKARLIMKPAEFIINLLRRAAIFQTGKLQHYVLYLLIFLLIFFMLTFLKLI
jgi:hydrogenase-4 component B